MLRFILSVLFFSIFGCIKLTAQEVMELGTEVQGENVSHFLYTFEDSTNRMSLQEVISQTDSKFKQVKTDNPNLGFKKTSIWIKFRARNTANTSRYVFLEFDYPLLDKMDIYQQDENNNWVSAEKTVGDRVPFSNRSIFFRNIVFPLQFKALQTKTYLIRIKTDSSVQFPAYLYDFSSLTKHISKVDILFGIFYGIFLVMGIYNFVLFFAIKDKSYLFYFIYILFYSLAQSSLNGHSFQYAWQNSLWWANTVIPVSLNLGATGAVVFLIYFLDTKKYLPRFTNILWGIVLLFGIFALLSFFLEYGVGVKIGTLVMIFLGFFETIIGGVVFRAGNKSAGYFVISWSLFLFGIVVTALVAMGAVPNLPLFRVAAPLGAVFQVMGLSFALADRINIIRKEKEKAQAESIKQTQENARIIQEQNEMLEKKVDERTRELQQKQEEILVQNEELQQQREEIMAQRDFISVKNGELQELNLHMTQSIQYASQIQRAILPDEGIIKSNVSDFFILYLPRDVVSGDFYWYSKIGKKQFFAAVDCTGHGVPGAFMSMIGNALLNKIINENEVYSPAKVLEMLNEGVIEALKQRETSNNDGMDVCLCCIEERSNGQFLLSYAGARRPLYLFKDNEILELKGSRNHIGGSSIGLNQNPFEDAYYVLDKGDAVYLSTDGLADNPNPQREKFGSERIKTLLLLYGKSTMAQQRKFLIDELKTFQKNTAQRDDILFMGVRV
ncbi:MAG: 7TM diverse intracellular signaling domain-containing protein [Thermonemataceae bacterium]|nr:7TM diverse intracellular signaling domain-containing protein [Thermonemataceae bacterium]